MDDKFDKKKESIDDILSDLNGLLNKMPSILDGIKMPEMQPQDYATPAQEPEPQAPRPEAVKEVPAEPAAPERTPAPAEPFDAEKTVVLESFSGLPEGSQVPGEISFSQQPEPASPQEPAAPQPEAASPGEAGGGAAPEQEKLAVQSLGDFMFGQEAEQEKPAAAGPVKLSGAPLEPPAEEPVRNVVSGPSLSISEFAPPPSDEVPAPEVPAAAFPEADLPGIPEPAPDEMIFSPGGDAARAAEQPPADFNAGEAGADEKPGSSVFETSRDFGVPDIDALMQLSEGEKPAEEQPAQPLPEAGMLPGSVQSPEAEKEGLPAPDSGFSETAGAPAQTEEEPQPAAEAPVEEASSPVMEPGEFIIEPGSKPEKIEAETSFEAFTIEPSSPEPAPAQEGGEVSPEAAPEPEPVQGGGETLSLDQVPEPLGKPATEPQPAVSQELQFESFSEPAPEPKLEAGPEIQSGAPADPESEPKPEAGPEAQFGAPAGPGSEPELVVGQGIQFGSGTEQPPPSDLELSPAIELTVGSQQSSNPDETLPGVTPASQTPSGDETLVVAPRAESSGEEEKTVIFQASPDTTTRAQAKDLGTLSAKQAPEGILPERVRTLVFLYSPGDEALCATVLAELDAICLKSAAKPMFIKRAYVKECESDVNANFVHQSVTDSGAQGLICLGAVPQEKVYEIENAFASSAGFFRYFDASTFTHSSALDLVADLIIR